MDDTVEISDEIRYEFTQLRYINGLSYRKLAKMIPCAETTLVSVLSNRKRCTPMTATKILNFLKKMKDKSE